MKEAATLRSRSAASLSVVRRAISSMIQLALQSGFLNQHGFAGLLGGKGIPENEVVLPPGVVGGEVDGLAPEGGGETVLNAAFVLADGDELLRAGGADGVVHGARPVREGFLREEEIVVQAKRVGSGVHAAGRELILGGKGDRACNGTGRNIPERGEFRPVGVALGQPSIPSREFDEVAIGAGLPEMLREAGLVDEIPGEIRHVVKACDDGGDQSLLAADGSGIEESVRASEDVGQKGEEIELHRQAILACGH